MRMVRYITDELDCFCTLTGSKGDIFKGPQEFALIALCSPDLLGKWLVDGHMCEWCDSVPFTVWAS